MEKAPTTHTACVCAQVATCTLNEPQFLNCLSDNQIWEYKLILDHATRDDKVGNRLRDHHHHDHNHDHQQLLTIIVTTTNHHHHHNSQVKALLWTGTFLRRRHLCAPHHVP